MPLWSSLATMSPATSAVISGKNQIEPKRSITSGIARPGRVDVAAERHVLGLAALDRDGDDEDDGTSGGGAEAEVRALLRAQLAQLPAVDGERARHSCQLLGEPPPRDRAASPAPSPSVRSKKSSSSDAMRGASSRISAPASVSASDSAPTAASPSARNVMTAVVAARGVRDARAARRRRASARSSSVVRRR